MMKEQDLLELPIGTIVHWRREDVAEPHQNACRPALLIEHFEGFMSAPMAWLAIFEPDCNRRRLAYWAPGPGGWHPAEDCAEVLAKEKERAVDVAP